MAFSVTADASEAGIVIALQRCGDRLFSLAFKILMLEAFSFRRK